MHCVEIHSNNTLARGHNWLFCFWLQCLVYGYKENNSHQILLFKCSYKQLPYDLKVRYFEANLFLEDDFKRGLFCCSLYTAGFSNIFFST